jgi:hypothetical protein
MVSGLSFSPNHLDSQGRGFDFFAGDIEGANLERITYTEQRSPGSLKFREWQALAPELDFGPGCGHRQLSHGQEQQQ